MKRDSKKWSDREDHLILSSGLHAGILAERFGRSQWSVERRRQRLKGLLPQHAEGTQLEVKIFKKLRKIQNAKTPKRAEALLARQGQDPL